MAEPRRTAVTAALPYQDGRSAMARASDGRPVRDYVASERAARQEPPEVTAARERHRTRTAELERGYAAGEARLEELVAARRVAMRREESAPDVAPGPEWYRERAAEDEDELAELDAARGRYQEAMALAAPPQPHPPPVTTASRCRRCGYLTTAVGHKVACDG